MDIIKQLAPHFNPYISITNVSDNTYTYDARTKDKKLPVLNHILHQKKNCGDSMLYIAIPAGANVNKLNHGEKLYVGSQSATDRMFRGDGMKGLNFHHAEMRNGNNGNSLITYLNSGRSVDILNLKSQHLIELTKILPSFSKIEKLASGIDKLLRGGNYAGFWFEQLILRDELKDWAWNTKGADANALQALTRYGV